MKLTDIFNDVRILNYSNRLQDKIQNNEEEKLLGSKLFTEIKQDELDITDILGSNNKVVEGSLVSFNSESKELDSEPFSLLDIESHKISNIRKIDEKKYIQLKGLFEKTKEESLKKLLLSNTNKVNFIFNETDFLVKAVNSVVEDMRMKLITYGKIEKNIDDKDDVKININYFRDTKNTVKLTGDKRWTVTTTTGDGEYKSNPLQDIEDMCNHLASISERPSVIYCTTEAFNTFKNHPIVRLNILGGLNIPGFALSLPVVNNYLESMNLPKIVIYDKGRIVRSRKNDKITDVFKKYLDTDVFVFAPFGTLGTTVYTKTAEESAFLDNHEELEDENNFIFSKLWIQEEPSFLAYVKACTITAISCPSINKTACIKFK